MEIRERERRILLRLWNKGLPTGLYRIVYFSAGPAYPDKEAKSAKTLRTLQLRFEKYDLVICDEFGYVSCDKEGGELLFTTCR